MTDIAQLFIDCRCELGEGPIWNPLQRRLFWFDITNQTLFSADANGIMVDRFIFEAPVSAAAVIDADNLAIAAAGGLFKLELSTDTRELILPIEVDKPGNRSNDSRVHPSGAFWIGTMPRAEDGPFGAVYHYRGGALATVRTGITVPNSICFSPDGSRAYFADTPTGTIETCAVDPGTGLPTGPWAPFAKTEGHGMPDGAVVDAAGHVWSARWGGSCLVRYAPDGSVDRIVEIPASRVTCPCFGGDDLRTLYVTSARGPLSPEEREREPLAGSIFSIRVDVPGQPEPLLAL